ncbi:MAG: SPOR domain-containing protein [Rhodanobacteraceae bacterium]
MEPALKTRLLGAAVLVALAIIFVPRFFSGASHNGTDEQSVSLKIPDQPDAQLQTKTLLVGPDSASANAHDPDRVTTVNADVGKPAPSPQDVAVAPSQSAPATSAKQTATAPAANTQAAKITPPAAPVQTPAPAVASAPGTAANASYALNLGVYAERANADKLIATMSKQGYSAHGESATYRGKPATRVVVGPFADRAAAEAARLKLKSAQPKVPVALMASAGDQTADAPATAVPANKAGGWAVQLGAFGNEVDANKLRDRLRALGFDGYVDGTPNGEGKLYRVRAGPVNERARAEELKAQIAAKMKISGIVVTQG